MTTIRAREDESARTDEQLTERARGGDRLAFGELYRRHHRAARSTARWLLRSRNDADDVVAEAFAGVLSAIDSGHGPRSNFRRYLLACVRNGCRTRRPVIAIDDSEGDPDERRAPMFEDPERYAEADAVARAFASLTPRWQETLWLTEVEQWRATEVGWHLHLTPNATAVMTRRARDAFATAYLAQHVARTPTRECVDAPRLAGYVRDQLTDAQRLPVERHLIGCTHCAKAADDLRDVNTSLRSLGAPLPLAVQALTQPATIGTSVGFGGGVMFKAAAALLAITPALGDSTGRGSEARWTDAEVAEVAEVDDAQLPDPVATPTAGGSDIADTATPAGSETVAIAPAAPATLSMTTPAAALTEAPAAAEVSVVVEPSLSVAATPTAPMPLGPVAVVLRLELTSREAAAAIASEVRLVRVLVGELGSAVAAVSESAPADGLLPDLATGSVTSNDSFLSSPSPALAPAPVPDHPLATPAPAVAVPAPPSPEPTVGVGVSASASLSLAPLPETHLVLPAVDVAVDVAVDLVADLGATAAAVTIALPTPTLP